MYSGKEFSQSNAKQDKPARKKQEEKLEEDMDLDDMVVMDDVLVEPQSTEVFPICVRILNI